MTYSYSSTLLHFLPDKSVEAEEIHLYCLHPLHLYTLYTSTPFGLKGPSIPLQKGPNGCHGLIVTITVNVVSGTTDVSGLSVCPVLHGFLGDLGCDDGTSRFAGDEQDGAGDMLDDVTPGPVEEPSTLKDGGIELGFGVDPREELLFDPVGIFGMRSGDTLITRERLDIVDPLPG